MKKWPAVKFLHPSPYAVTDGLTLGSSCSTLHRWWTHQTDRRSTERL